MMCMKIEVEEGNRGWYQETSGVVGVWARWGHGVDMERRGVRS